MIHGPSNVNGVLNYCLETTRILTHWEELCKYKDKIKMDLGETV